MFGVGEAGGTLNVSMISSHRYRKSSQDHRKTLALGEHPDLGSSRSVGLTLFHSIERLSKEVKNGRTNQNSGGVGASVHDGQAGLQCAEFKKAMAEITEICAEGFFSD